eukprot:SM000032S12165  [mRNA]  locus=s32:940315:946351:- [translate_table: standard]
MDEASLALAERLVSPSYIRQGGQALARRRKMVKALLSQRQLPQEPWDDDTIEWLIQDLACMDSNNFVDNVGIGEREARCASELVRRRHYGLAHGIGRSGNIADEQPKASPCPTVVCRADNFTVPGINGDKFSGQRCLGYRRPQGCGCCDSAATCNRHDNHYYSPRAKIQATSILFSILPRFDLIEKVMVLFQVCPMAKNGPKDVCEGSHVCWTRPRVYTYSVDCVTMQVISSILEGDQVCTNVTQIEQEICTRGADNIVCVLTTTSCFAPRAADRVEEVAKLCHRYGVGHIINNAYGVQASSICESVTRAWRRGRVDGIIQSTDKNFMVPVGGAVLASGAKDASLVDAVNALYPGWRKLLDQRQTVFTHLHYGLAALAEEQGERLLSTPQNPISMAMSLSTLQSPSAGEQEHVGLGNYDSAEAPEKGSLRPLSALAREDRGKSPAMDPPLQSSESELLGRAAVELEDSKLEVEQEHTGGSGRSLTFLGSMLFMRYYAELAMRWCPERGRQWEVIPLTDTARPIIGVFCLVKMLKTGYRACCSSRTADPASAPPSARRLASNSWFSKARFASSYPAKFIAPSGAIQKKRGKAPLKSAGIPSFVAMALPEPLGHSRRSSHHARLDHIKGRRADCRRSTRSATYHDRLPGSEFSVQEPPHYLPPAGKESQPKQDIVLAAIRGHAGHSILPYRAHKSFPDVRVQPCLEPLLQNFPRPVKPSCGMVPMTSEKESVDACTLVCTRHKPHTLNELDAAEHTFRVSRGCMTQVDSPQARPPARADLRTLPAGIIMGGDMGTTVAASNQTMLRSTQTKRSGGRSNIKFRNWPYATWPSSLSASRHRIIALAFSSVAGSPALRSESRT